VRCVGYAAFLDGFEFYSLELLSLLFDRGIAPHIHTLQSPVLLCCARVYIMCKDYLWFYNSFLIDLAYGTDMCFNKLPYLRFEYIRCAWAPLGADTLCAFDINR